MGLSFFTITVSGNGKFYYEINKQAMDRDKTLAESLSWPTPLKIEIDNGPHINKLII